MAKQKCKFTDKMKAKRPCFRKGSFQTIIFFFSSVQENFQCEATHTKIMNSENDKRFTLYIIETIIISNQTIK